MQQLGIGGLAITVAITLGGPSATAIVLDRPVPEPLPWHPVLSQVLSQGSNPDRLPATSIPLAIREAYTFLQQGLINDAIPRFEAAVRQYPQSLEAKLGLSIAYRRAGQIQQAWDLYHVILAQFPDQPLVLKSVGVVGSYRPEWQQQGIAALDRLLALHPDDPDAHGLRGRLYSYRGEFEKALADLEIALVRQPRPEVQLDAAEVYTYTGQPDRALPLFAAALGSQPGLMQRSIGVPLAYAQALRETGALADAFTVLQAALASQPGDHTPEAAQLRAGLALTYLDNQQPEAALTVLEPLRGREDALRPLASALNAIGQREVIPELRQEAARLYRQLLAQTADPDPGLLREVADVLSSIPGEAATALALYRQMAATQPDDPAFAIRQISLQAQLNQLPRATLWQRLQPYVDPLPDNFYQKRRIAQALVLLEPLPELIPVYRQLLAEAVGEPFLNFRLAQALVEINALAEAKVAIATYQAFPTAAKDLTPELLLAEIDRRLGNLEASATRYQALIDRQPADINIWDAALRGLAGVRVAQGRAQEALAVYDQLRDRYPDSPVVQLGWTSVAYQAEHVSLSDAESVLDDWLATRPETETPIELYDLVATLPPDPDREPLYRRLVDNDPTNIPLQLRLMQALVTLQARDEAAKRGQQLLERAQAVIPDYEQVAAYWVLAGQVAHALGDNDRAESALQKALDREPENANILALLAGIYFENRRYTAAQRLYRRLADRQPENREASRSLAELSAVQGNRLDALQKMQTLQRDDLARGTSSPALEQRLQELQIELLKQRGFQPEWERF